MAALYDPRYDFTPAHTAGDRSISLAERDPAYLQFKQAAMKKYSNLSPVAIANLFHRSKEQRNILPPLDVDAIAENDIQAETAAPPALTNDAKPVFHMGIGNIAGLEARQNDERNALGALNEYYSNMTADQYAQEVAAQKNLTPTLTAAARIKEKQERERLALALSTPPNQSADDAPVLSTESSSYDHIPFAANTETQDFSQQNPPMGMSFNPPVPALTTPNENGTVVTKDNTGPVLRQPTSNTASNGNATRRMTGGYTGNARGSDLPDMQIGLNERLMRMGAAGLAAGGQGSLAQLGAMFGASANVNQLNRQAEMEAFGIEEERRQAHAARVAQLAASKNKGAGGGDIDSYAARNTLLQLQNAEEILQGFDDFDGVTGPFNWFISGWDSSGFGDAARENVRLKIAKMKVDATLARTALTKGAISDSEMTIFTSDQPSFYKSEAVWREWVKNYIRALKTMHTNLSTGQTPYKNGGGGGSAGSTTQVDVGGESYGVKIKKP